MASRNTQMRQDADRKKCRDCGGIIPPHALRFTHPAHKRPQCAECFNVTEDKEVIDVLYEGAKEYLRSMT